MSIGRTILWMTLAFAMSICVARGQTEIRLLTSARVAQAPVRVADVAVVAGARAAEIGRVVVRESVEADRITLDEVREAIREHVQGLDWGRTAISGGTCAIVVATTRDESATDEESRRPTRASEMPPGTVGTLIAAKIAGELGVEPASLRFLFNDHSEIIREKTAGRTVELNLQGIGDRTPVRVRLYEGDRMVAAGSTTAEVEVEREVAVALRRVERGSTIGPEDVRRELMWLRPSETPASPASLAGQAASRLIREGQVVGESDVRAPIVVERGDIVVVHCFAGSLHGQLRAKAMSPARDGEVIEFETLEADRKLRRIITARVNGPGRAIIAVGRTGETP